MPQQPTSNVIGIVVCDTRRHLTVGPFATEGQARLWADTWIGDFDTEGGDPSYLLVGLHAPDALSDVIAARLTCDS